MKKTFTEDELEEDGEDQQEEQLQPESGAKKRSAEAQPHDAAANSDEDLPEVFSMIEGKSMARQLRNEEKASGRRIAAEVKKKKQERAASRKNEKAKLGLSSQEELTAAIDDKDPEQSNMNGLLDDTIVQFLSAREKAELDEVKLVSSPPAEIVKIKRSKSKTKTERSNSRVQVVDLSRNPSFVEERNALEFKQGQLYGNRIKRDPSMLRRLTRVP